MTTTITMAGQKGGTGKSTLAIHLAAEWQRRGYRVLVLDADPQGTALTWSEEAAERGLRAPTITAMGDNLRAQLPDLRKGYDIVIVDTAGRQSKRLAGALALTDLAIVPCKPSAADVWALGETIDLIERVQEIQPALEARIVRNEIQRTAMAEAAQSIIEDCALSSFKTMLGRRVAFAEAMAEGKGVTAHAPGSLAALELTKLADEIEELLSIQEAEHAA